MVKIDYPTQTESSMKKKPRKNSPKFGLALSGGGARGFAHIGLLKVLDREKIRPSYLSGTSMGAIIAAAYASGMSGKDIEEEAIKYTRTRNLVRMVHLTPPFKGLINQQKVAEYLSELIPHGMRFDELRIPLAICATDLLRSRPVSLTEGLVLPAVLASASIPGVFPPVVIPPYRLVDGGVVNNLPVDLAYQLGAEKVVAVDVQINPFETTPWQDKHKEQKWSLPISEYIMDMLWSETIMSARITQLNLKTFPPDIYIRMPINKEITVLMGFPHAQEIIDKGEETAEEYLPIIKQMLGMAVREPIDKENETDLQAQELPV